MVKNNWRIQKDTKLISNNKLAIFLIIISVFCGTLMLTFLKLAQEEVNVYVAGFFRFLFGLLIIFPYMLKSNFAVFKTKMPEQVIIIAPIIVNISGISL